MKKNRLILWIAISLVATGLAILLIFLYNLPPGTWQGNFFDIVKSGQVGDFAGGIVGSLWALAGVILLFYNLYLQGEQIKKQQEQQSEATYYKLLDYHKETINGFGHDKLSEIYTNIRTNIKKYKGNLSARKFTQLGFHLSPRNLVNENPEIINQINNSISHIIFYIEKYFSEKELYQEILYNNVLSPAEKYLFGLCCYLDFYSKANEIKKMKYNYLGYYTNSGAYFYDNLEGDLPEMSINLVDNSGWSLISGRVDNFCKVQVKNISKKNSVKLCSSKWKILNENFEWQMDHNSELKPGGSIDINFYSGVEKSSIGNMIADIRKNSSTEQMLHHKLIEVIFLVEFHDRRLELQFERIRLNVENQSYPEARLTFYN